MCPFSVAPHQVQQLLQWFCSVWITNGSFKGKCWCFCLVAHPGFSKAFVRVSSGSRNNCRPRAEARSAFIFFTWPDRGSPEQQPGRGTQVGMQALMSSVHARGLLTCCLHLLIERPHRCGFATLLSSSVCFDLLHTSAGSSRVSRRAPPSLPNTYVSYAHMCYLSNT